MSVKDGVDFIQNGENLDAAVLNRPASDLGDEVDTALLTKTDKTTTLTAGSGLTGGGDLSQGRTFNLGAPSTLTLSSSNNVTGTSHTHNLNIANATASSAGLMSAGDKSKLNGIESGATADQTKSDIDALGINASTVGGISPSNIITSSKAASSAYKLETARTIALSGDVSGSTTFDGSANRTINVTVKDSDKVDGIHASQFLRSDVSTTLDAGRNTTLTVKSGDDGQSVLNLVGDTQGTGIVYVGQSSTHGGGVFYNGDGTPAFASGEAPDKISFYRRASGSNTVVFDYGHSSNNVNFKGSISVAGDVTAASDIRLKDNFKRIDDALNKVGLLNGYTFDRKDLECGTRQTGVIAQEVQSVLPEAVYTQEESGYLSVAYGNMIGLLIEAIKEQQDEISKLKERIY